MKTRKAVHRVPFTVYRIVRNKRRGWNRGIEFSAGFDERTRAFVTFTLLLLGQSSIDRSPIQFALLRRYMYKISFSFSHSSHAYKKEIYKRIENFF